MSLIGGAFRGELASLVSKFGSTPIQPKSFKFSQILHT
jgi:hypothetical protein